MIRMYLLVLLTGFLLFGCKSSQKAKEEAPPIPVKLARVWYDSLTIPVHSAGLLFAAAESKLSFKTGGILKTIAVKEGEKVTKGQILAWLDLTEIQARYRQALSAFRKAERDFNRVKKLYADSVATLEQKQNAQTALEVAKADLNIAKFNLKHSEIRAPSVGVVLKIIPEINEMVAPGQPVFLFGSETGNKILKAGVTDKHIARIQLGDKAEIEFDAYPEKKFKATVSEISGTIDPMSSTYEVKLKLLPEKTKLFSGFVGKVTIYPSKRVRAALIPYQSLVEADGDRGYVFIVKPDSSVKRVKVSLLQTMDQRIAVKSGLEGIERVVAEGAAYLSDGSKVIPR